MPRHLVGIFSARREISRRRHPDDPLTPGTPSSTCSSFSSSSSSSLNEQSGSGIKRGEEKSLQKFLFSNGEHQRCEPSFLLFLGEEWRGGARYSRRYSSSNPFSFPPSRPPRVPAPETMISQEERGTPRPALQLPQGLPLPGRN